MYLLLFYIKRRVCQVNDNSVLIMLAFSFTVNSMLRKSIVLYMGLRLWDNIDTGIVNCQSEPNVHGEKEVMVIVRQTDKAECI